MNITERQLEIIDAAGHILTDSGVAGLTTKNLAKAMDFSEGALYRHFSGKEEIIVSMLEYLAETMDQRLHNALKGLTDPVERFEALFESQLQFFQDNPQFVVAVFSDGLFEVSERINDTILQLMMVKMKHLIPILQDGQAKGPFNRNIQTEDLAQIVMGTFRLLMFKWRIMGFMTDLRRNGRNTIQALLTTIRCKDKQDEIEVA